MSRHKFTMLSFHVFLLSIISVLIKFSKACSEIKIASGEAESFENSSRILNKTTNSYQSSTACDCGFYSTRCYFKHGKKVCECLENYAESFGLCEQCNCGYFSKGCEFDGMVKNCRCYDGYFQLGNSCSGCDCGYKSTKCKIIHNSKKCTCEFGYIQIGDRCKSCDCGYLSASCSFSSDGKKKCVCRSGYVVKSDFFNEEETCVACECGPGSISCYFNFFGDRKCNCKKGFAAKPVGLYKSDEYCTIHDVSTFSSSWRIATHVEGVLFGVMIVGLLVFICFKKKIK